MVRKELISSSPVREPEREQAARDCLVNELIRAREHLERMIADNADPLAIKVQRLKVRMIRDSLLAAGHRSRIWCGV